MSENFIDFGLETAEKQFIARNMGGKNILLPYTLRSTEVINIFQKIGLNLSLIIIYLLNPNPKPIPKSKYIEKIIYHFRVKK